MKSVISQLNVLFMMTVDLTCENFHQVCEFLEKVSLLLTLFYTMTKELNFEIFFFHQALLRSRLYLFKMLMGVCVAVRSSVLQCAAVCCSVLWCVVACCSM